jgi:nucleotide-binding universal stress UspA family protein
MTPVSALPEPGEVVDGFLVGERVHAGGMGVIHRVTREDLERPALMKLPRLGHGEPASSVISFEVEQMILAALQGPHVPRFVAAGDVTLQPYLVMEEIAGASLSTWADRAPLPAAEVARLGAALAAALDDLHRQGAIHLDVKPSNVIVRPDGSAVLIDLGLAHHAHYPDLLAEESSRPIGSAPYLSPEQVVGVRSDPRSDVFSLGAVLYQLATGRLPFGSPGPAGLRRRLWRDPLPVRALAREQPEWLQEVVLRCLEPDASRRPTAAQVAFDLAHPGQVAVGERGRRLRRAGPVALARQWLRAAGYVPAPLPAAAEGPAIVLAAVAVQHGDEAQLEALRDAVRPLVGAGAGSDARRLACVTVIRPTPELGGSGEEETAARQRLKHLALLRAWAEPLGLGPARSSFHVLEASDPAGALLTFARQNRVDHVVVGAPADGIPLRALLGTVATKLVLEAPCSVTVVRPGRSGAAAVAQDPASAAPPRDAP